MRKIKLSVLGEGAEFSVFSTLVFCPALAVIVSPVPNIIIPLRTLFHFFNPHRPATWRRILWRIRTKVFRVFLLAVHSHLYCTNKFYLPPPFPVSKSGLKLVCNVNILHRNFKSETLKIMPRNLNKIVSLWIQLLERQTCWVACLCVPGSELLTTKMREILVSPNWAEKRKITI